MTIERIIVAGASAGGVESLMAFSASLPTDFGAPVFVVMHIAPNYVSKLPEILSRSGPLPAQHPADGEKFKPGHIYIAPPDHHLLIEGDRVIVIGRVETRIYTPTQGPSAGQEVRKLEVVVDEIGPSLRWAEANVQRVAGQRSDESAALEEIPV